MQAEPTGGTSPAGDEDYRDAQVSYRDVQFDYELALRASFARSWRNVERRSASDHGSEDMDDSRNKARNDDDDDTEFRQVGMRNIRGQDGKLRRVRAYQPAAM